MLSDIQSRNCNTLTSAYAYLPFYSHCRVEENLAQPIYAGKCPIAKYVWRSLLLAGWSNFFTTSLPFFWKILYLVLSKTWSKICLMWFLKIFSWIRSHHLSIQAKTSADIIIHLEPFSLDSGWSWWNIMHQQKFLAMISINDYSVWVKPLSYIISTLHSF